MMVEELRQFFGYDHRHWLQPGKNLVLPAGKEPTPKDTFIIPDSSFANRVRHREELKSQKGKKNHLYHTVLVVVRQSGYKRSHKSDQPTTQECALLFCMYTDKIIIRNMAFSQTVKDILILLRGKKISLLFYDRNRSSSVKPTFEQT